MKTQPVAAQYLLSLKESNCRDPSGPFVDSFVISENGADVFEVSYMSDVKGQESISVVNLTKKCAAELPFCYGGYHLAAMLYDFLIDYQTAGDYEMFADSFDTEDGDEKALRIEFNYHGIVLFGFAEQDNVKKFTAEEFKKFRDENLAGWSSLQDNRFAVVNEVHYDLTDYECEEKSYSVVTEYDAEGCYNMSHAGESYMNDESIKAAYVFLSPSEAKNFFLAQIAKAMI